MLRGSASSHQSFVESWERPAVRACLDVVLVFDVLSKVEFNISLEARLTCNNTERPDVAVGPPLFDRMSLTVTLRSIARDYMCFCSKAQVLACVCTPSTDSSANSILYKDCRYCQSLRQGLAQAVEKRALQITDASCQLDTISRIRSP